jgi:hypothetical protein
MSKILRLKDRVNVKIDDVSLKLSPLSYLQKMEIQDYMIEASSGDMKAAMKGAALAIKYCVKHIDGVEDYSDKKYELSFDDSGHLTDECVDDLLNLRQSEKLMSVCATLLQGLPEGELLHPVTGQPIEGSSFGAVEGK